ncbi:unnamed protein product [Soboliphyme baturini]|uniref:Apple domain-containing protein n=1 Tax=Soboliphyme baturini TaxID=241478 RepID=A0A183IAM1_9BILA|nr:unnamed protein product [Soboliphyme baturini]
MVRRKCMISKVRAKPDGDAVLIPLETAVYFEKFCLPRNDRNPCREQFFYLFPGKDFYVESIHIASAASLRECAEICVRQDCLTAVYNADSHECHIKDLTAANKRSYLADKTNSYYFENGCKKLSTFSIESKLNN